MAPDTDDFPFKPDEDVTVWLFRDDGVESRLVVIIQRTRTSRPELKIADRTLLLFPIRGEEEG